MDKQNLNSQSEPTTSLSLPLISVSKMTTSIPRINIPPPASITLSSTPQALLTASPSLLTSSLAASSSSSSSFTVHYPKLITSSTDTNFQGGKIVHHLGHGTTLMSKGKLRDMQPVKIEVNLTADIKQERRDDVLPGPSSRGDESSSTYQQPLKKMKIELKESGVWEAKMNSNDIILPIAISTNNNNNINNNDDDDDNDDGEGEGPIDYKSRWIALIEDQMQEAVKYFKFYISELFFLEGGNDFIDYFIWVKKHNPSYYEFLSRMAIEHNVDIELVQSDETKGVATSSGVMPTITPVAISKTLPPAITELLKQQQNNNNVNNNNNTSADGQTKRHISGFHSVVYGPLYLTNKCTSFSGPLVPGGMPLSTTAATTTIGSPSSFTSLFNFDNSVINGDKIVTTSTTSTLMSAAVKIKPASVTNAKQVAMMESPSSFVGNINSNSSYHDNQPKINALAVTSYAQTKLKDVKVASTIATAAAVSSPLLAATTNATSEAAIVELAKQEAKVMYRIAELRRQGLWSLRRLPKVMETQRSKSHWDMLLSEMQWMAVDFAQERRWKLASSAMLSTNVVKNNGMKRRMEQKVQEETRKRKLARRVGSIVNDFWKDNLETYLYRTHKCVDETSDQLLEYIFNEAARPTHKNLVSNIDPNMAAAFSDSEDSNFELELNDLLTQAKKPIEEVIDENYNGYQLNDATFPSFMHGDDDYDRQIDGDDYDSHVVGNDDDDYDYYPEDFDSNYLPGDESDDAEDDSSLPAGEEVDSAVSIKEEKIAFETIEDFISSCHSFTSSFSSTSTSPKSSQPQQLLTPPSLFSSSLVTLNPPQSKKLHEIFERWLSWIPHLEMQSRCHQRGNTRLDDVECITPVVHHLAQLAFNNCDWGCHLVIVQERKHLYTWKNLFWKLFPGLDVAVVIGGEERSGKEEYDDKEAEVMVDDNTRNARRTKKIFKKLSKSVNVCLATAATVMNNLETVQSIQWRTLVLYKIADSHSYASLAPLNCRHLIVHFDPVSLSSLLTSSDIIVTSLPSLLSSLTSSSSSSSSSVLASLSLDMKRFLISLAKLCLPSNLKAALQGIRGADGKSGKDDAASGEDVSDDDDEESNDQLNLITAAKVLLPLMGEQQITEGHVTEGHDAEGHSSVTLYDVSTCLSSKQIRKIQKLEDGKRSSLSYLYELQSICAHLDDDCVDDGCVLIKDSLTLPHFKSLQCKLPQRGGVQTGALQRLLNITSREYPDKRPTMKMSCSVEELSETGEKSKSCKSSISKEDDFVVHDHHSAFINSNNSNNGFVGSNVSGVSTSCTAYSDDRLVPIYGAELTKCVLDVSPKTIGRSLRDMCQAVSMILNGKDKLNAKDSMGNVKDNNKEEILKCCSIVENTLAMLKSYEKSKISPKYSLINNLDGAAAADDDDEEREEDDGQSGVMTELTSVGLNIVHDILQR
ncbi:hypothetical protein HELRODRAFT_165732 [Helobdella robusta]|uniref:HSA domain-containing protein n=1 Tax=Helobdella robusta TaxID=6412 RepID=T1EX80_HELRO|nr:hypothetical protein HELRODRAFT_165732 [Helobdella robusta]ESN91675.1 hypothetical protein HELRODRAFT_165732 [Helobdella robusta]